MTAAIHPDEQTRPADEFREGQDLLWASKDYDFPVKFLNMVDEKGSDGRVYARVEMEGRETYAPMDELKAAPPPKSTADATVAPTPIGPEGLHVTGDAGDAVSDDEKARRAAILAMELKAMDEESAAEVAAEEQRKREVEAERAKNHRDKTMLGSIYTRRFMHIEAGENFFNIKPHQDMPGQQDRTLSDRQLKALILSAALDKNWNTLYLYKDRSTIDPSLTARAQQMIAELQRDGQPLHGITLRVSPTRMRDVEPWNQGRLLYSAFRSAANYRDDKVEAFTSGVSTRWNGLMMSALFKKTAAATPEAQANAPEDKPKGTTIKDGPDADEATPAADTAAADGPAATKGTATPDTAAPEAAAEAPAEKPGQGRRANPGAGMGAAL